MSNHPKRPYAEVLPFAESTVETLRPYCRRIQVAGSLRRECEMVSDIEIVCEPIIDTREEVTEGDLFNPVEKVRTNLLDQAVNRLLIGPHDWQPRLDKNGRQAIGERCKRLQVYGAPLDLFCVVEPASWGVILAIRTGPAEFSRRLVTQRHHGGCCHLATPSRAGS